METLRLRHGLSSAEIANHTGLKRSVGASPMKKPEALEA
jgi:hypothetical protein